MAGKLLEIFCRDDHDRFRERGKELFNIIYMGPLLQIKSKVRFLQKK